MNPTFVLTLASLKMYFRNRQALFWALFLPVLIMSILGVLDFGAFSPVRIGVVDEAQTPTSLTLVEAIGKSGVFEFSEGTSEALMENIQEGQLDIVAKIPKGFGSTTAPTTITLLVNQGRGQWVSIGQTTIRRVLDRMTLAITATPQLFLVDTISINSKNLRYIDFLMPGILAMSIMQMGIFSVTFSFIQFRQQGVLRRLRAAPITPAHFLVGQILTRLIVTVLQSVVILGIALLFFQVHIQGNLLEVIALAGMGGALFITIGFAVSGFAKSEEVAAPLANVVAMPMMFLSGVFFPRDSLPTLLERFTDYLPLTYLSNGMRAITVDGASLGQVWTDFLGLIVWLILALIVAVRAFRWE